MEEINKYAQSTSAALDVSGMRRSYRDYERSPGKIFTNQPATTKNSESLTQKAAAQKRTSFTGGEQTNFDSGSANNRGFGAFVVNKEPSKIISAYTERSKND